MRSAIQSNALNLAVFVVNEGFRSKHRAATSPPVRGARTDSRCRKPHDYDYPGLTECAKRLKDSSADFKDETQVTITANPGIDYQTLIRAIDALRRSKDGEDLFPDVHFGVPR